MVLLGNNRPLTIYGPVYRAAPRRVLSWFGKPSLSQFMLSLKNIRNSCSNLISCSVHRAPKGLGGGWSQGPSETFSFSKKTLDLLRATPT